MAITPNYSWPLPDDTSLVKDGAEAIRDLGNAIDTTVDGLGSGGLVHIKTVTDTGVASLSIGSDADPLFTSNFVNYKIIVIADQPTFANLRLRANTTDASGANYDRQNTTSVSSTITTGLTTGQTSYTYVSNFSGASESVCVLEIFRPQLASQTFIRSYSQIFNGVQHNINMGRHTLTTAFNGISFIMGSGNFTTITAKVYGYKD